MKRIGFRKKILSSLFCLCIAMVGVASADSISIRKAIFNAIDAHAGMGPYEVEIDASRGIVTLDGTVASESAKQFVADVARDQPGVARVINNLSVSGASQASKANIDLAKAVSAALSQASVQRKYSLNVRADESTITLSGEVGSESDKQMLEKTARLTPGVNEVVNNLTLRPLVSDDTLTQRVEAALVRNVPNLTDGVNVSVNQGVVTLSGSKRNHREIDHLLTVVLMVDGVRDVKSELILNDAG